MAEAYSYLVLSPIPEPHRSSIEKIMDEISGYAGRAPLYTHIIPHITFHRPFEGVSEEKICASVERAASEAHKATFTLGNPLPFGKHYVVLPVHVSLGLASLWVLVNRHLADLPAYKRGQYDFENTLHVTLAEKTAPVFDVLWKKVRNISIPEMKIRVDTLAVYRKPIAARDAEWKECASYSIQEGRTV